MLSCFQKTQNTKFDVSIGIDKEIKLERKRFKSRQNILLLGTGESGKSTFLKQIKIINRKRFTPEEIISFKDIIYDNIYKGILFLLDARKNINLDWQREDVSQKAADHIEEHFRVHRPEFKERQVTGQLLWSEEEFLSLVNDLTVIWSDQSIKDTFNQRSKIITDNFSENTRYYLNKIDRIAVKNYRPNNEDIVWSRKPTESIIEEEIEIHGSYIVFTDVGGQTRQRKKWCQVFQDMNSVLFLICCSHYDEHYYDKTSKETRNKLSEAMRVFEDLINVQYFLSVSVIIFFNKTDILTEKIDSKISNIRDEFPDYPLQFDPYNIVHVKQFLVDTIAAFVDNPEVPSITSPNSPRPSIEHKRRTLYRHFTTAVDQRNIETVFNAMKNIILLKNIDQLVMK